MQRRLCAAILVLEAVVLGLVTPVLITVAEVPAAQGLLLGLGLAAVAVLLAGMLRASWAFTLGWCLQVATIALALLVPAMLLLGLIFLGLWATAYFLGAKIERERAEWERTGQYPGRPQPE